jgi:hypothetical protein
MTDAAPIKDPDDRQINFLPSMIRRLGDRIEHRSAAGWVAEPVCGCGLADLSATARNAVRLQSDDEVPADIHMIRHSDEVPTVSDLLRHLG